MHIIENHAGGTIKRILCHALTDGVYGPGIGTTGPLETRTVKGTRTELLTREFVCQTMDWLIAVPPESGTDFASIPRVFWRLLDPYDPEYKPMAVIHDRLYRLGVLSRSECDAIFNQLMIQGDVSWWKRVLIYEGLAWCGWTGWNENRLGCEWWRARALWYQTKAMFKPMEAEA